MPLFFYLFVTIYTFSRYLNVQLLNFVHILCLLFYTTSQLCFPLQGDHSREKALDDMMDGVLEVKKDDILKMVGQNIKMFVKSQIYYLLLHNIKSGIKIIVALFDKQ